MRASPSVPSTGARIFAWIGAALFALSLGYFLYTYAVTFAETAAPGPVLAAAAWDVALFSAFALHHSLFARERVRRQIVRLAGPTLERSVYVWVASLLLAVVCAAWGPVPGVVWHLTGATAWLLRIVQLVAVWLTLRSAAVIDVWELAGVRQLSAGTAAPSAARDDGAAAADTEFKTTGPYGWVRHPIYSAWFLLVFATPVMTATQLVFAATSAVYLLIAIPFEETSLLGASGGAYGRYMRQVPWKLVPRIY